MPDRFPDLLALALLIDIGETGSIGAAARRHDMTQQGASERLRTLETRVGLTLVQRTPSGSTLTESGRLLAEWGGRLVDQAEALTDAVATLRDDRRRGLRVAASLTVAEHLLPDWIVRLRREHGVTVNLTATNSQTVARLVADGAVDVGFVEDDDVHTGLASLAITDDELVLVASPDDTWAGRTIAADVVAARSLTHREAGSGTRSVLEHELDVRGLVAAEPELELSSTVAIRSAVAAGGAPAFLSRRAVEADLAGGRLVRIDTDLVPRRVFSAVWVGSSTPPAGPVRDLLGIATR